MNSAHLHLILNHLPIIGTAFVAAFLAAAIYYRNAEFQRLSFAAFIFLALVTIAVYFSGEGAEEIVERLPGVSHDLIEGHEGSGLMVFIGMEVLGVGALAGLVMFRKAAQIPRNLALGVLALSLVCLLLASWAALLGGKIRHPEAHGAAIGAEAEPGGEEEDESGRRRRRGRGREE